MKRTLSTALCLLLLTSTLLHISATAQLEQDKVDLHVLKQGVFSQQEQKVDQGRFQSTQQNINQNGINYLLLELYHFNDVYDLLPTEVEPKQGVAYFKSLLDRYRDEKIHLHSNLSEYSLTLFAGDVFAPSLLSNQYRGWNMVEPLNSLGIDVACLGNHQFDYSQAELIKLTKATNFPWLGTNIFNKTTDKLIAEGKQFSIFYRSGYKIGVFSAVEEQWLHLIIPEYLENIEIRPFIELSQKMVNKLKNQQKCDFIIALTHMMKQNDRKLARQVQGIDLILGGHDHSIMHEQIGHTVIVKSGTDFQHFTKVQILSKKTNPNHVISQELPGQSIFYFQTPESLIKCTLVQVHHKKMKILPDPQLHQYVTELYNDFRQKQGKIALYTKNDIDLRFQVIRTSYSPYLHFVSELFRHDRGADCAFINSGGFRQQAVVKAGAITLGSLMNFIKDDIVVKKVPGKIMLQALQNSVSKFPSVSGRYLQFAKVQFTWDSSREPLNRVIKDSVRIKGEPLIMDKVYLVAFRGYIAEGGDGYFMIRQCPCESEIAFKQKFLIFKRLIEMDEDILRNQELRSQIEIIDVDGVKYVQLNIRQEGSPKVKMVTSATDEL